MDDLGVSISGSSVVRIATDWSALIHNKPLRDLDLYLSGEGDLTGEGDYIHTHKRKIALRQLLKSRKYDVFASYERHLSYGIEGVNTVKKYRHPDTEKEIDVIDCDEAVSESFLGTRSILQMLTEATLVLCCSQVPLSRDSTPLWSRIGFAAAS